MASACEAPSRAECFVDLKLGGLSDFGVAVDQMKEPAVPASAGAAAAVVPSASPMKRPRTGASGTGGAQCPLCAVDGCKADLSKCRDYHRRHKVCEAHSKMAMLGGVDLLGGSWALPLLTPARQEPTARRCLYSLEEDFC